MQKIAILGFVGCLLLVGGGGAPPNYTRGGEKKPDRTRPCPSASFAPEVHNLFGDATTVLAKLEKFDKVLKDRRVWGFIIESRTGSAQVVLFKKADKGDDEICTVYTASSKSGFSALRGKLEHAMLANAGVCCIGDLASGILTKELGDQLRTKEGVPAPTTLLAAIRHAVNEQGDQYMRVTLLLLC